MTTTAQEFADDYREAADEAIDFTENCTVEQWNSVTSEEGWTVAATISHIVQGNELVSGWLDSIRAGDAIDLTQDELDETNAQRAAEHAEADRVKTLESLRSSATELEAVLRGLGEEDLARTAPFALAGGQDFSCAQAAGSAARHVRSHLESARTAAGDYS